MKKSKYPNETTRLMMEGAKRRRMEWEAWRKSQAPIITRLLETAVRFSKRGLFQEATRAAWNAGQAIHEMDNVWMNVSAKGNEFIKSVPKGWERFSALKRTF